MAHATPPAPARTGGRISGYCSLDYGHRYCSPGPLVVHGEEILPRRCFCSCHKDGGKQ